MEDLKEIFNEIKSYDKSISSDTAIEVAIRIFISQNIQREKKEINTEPRNDPATSKQKNLLIKLGYRGNVNTLSKFDAGKLISEGIGK